MNGKDKRTTHNMKCIQLHLALIVPSPTARRNALLPYSAEQEAYQTRCLRLSGSKLNGLSLLEELSRRYQTACLLLSAAAADRPN